MPFERVQLKKREPVTIPSPVLSLTPEQQSVVHDTEGVRIVAACPGSGKTRVLVQSIIHLVQDMKVDPSSILAFTFTKQAALEMKTRLDNELTKTVAAKLHVSTIHSFFFQVLREQSEHEVVLIEGDKGQKRKVLREALKKCNQPFELLGEIENLISHWKSEGLTPIAVNAVHPAMESAAEVYKEYEAKKTKDHLVDFDDMLLHPYLQFQQAPITARVYQKRYRYIFVDEFHDSSRVEIELIRHLIGKKGNCFLVCDPNQSIYGFRGADVNAVVNYQQYFPNARLLRLTQNFRSTAEIVDACYHLIGHNENSKALQLTSFSERHGAGLTLLPVTANEKLEADHVAKTIKEIGGNWRDTVVLYRMNAQSRALEEAMSSASIPFEVVGDKPFYHRKEIHDIICYLMFLDDPHPLGEPFSYIYNSPNRFLSREWYSMFCQKARSIEDIHSILSSNFGAPYMNRSSRKLSEQISNMMLWKRRLDSGDLNLGQLATRILRIVGYEESLTQYPNREEMTQNLREFVSSLERFTSVKDFVTFLNILQSKAKQNKKREDRVSLMTIHKAKGLEFKNVFLIGCCDGVLPHYLNGVEEERRICFVAVSRAENQAYLSYTSTFRSNSANPSPFLSELGLLSEDSNGLEPVPHSDYFDVPANQAAC